YEIRVPLFSTMYRVPKGHRLRLGIAGSHFPLLWPAPVNPVLTVHRSPDHATCVRIPVITSNRDTAGPSFGPPKMAPARSTLHQSSDLQIVRDLPGSRASVQRSAVTTTRLADGSTLTMDSSDNSAIQSAHPGDMVL